MQVEAGIAIRQLLEDQSEKGRTAVQLALLELGLILTSVTFSDSVIVISLMSSPFYGPPSFISTFIQNLNKDL